MAELTELGKVLHEEHFRILVLISGLENRVTGRAADRPLDLENAEDRALLEELACSLHQVIAHNVFEEKVLFPLLSTRGVAELTGLLTQEHDVIGPMVRRVRSLALEILRCGNSPERQGEFRMAAAELVGEMHTHLQTEELGIVQKLRQFIDTETDHRLALAVSADREPDAASAGASPEETRTAPIPRRQNPANIAARRAARRRSTAAQPRQGGY